MPRSTIFSAVTLLLFSIYAILAFELIEVPGVDQQRLKTIAQNVRQSLSKTPQSASYTQSRFPYGLSRWSVSTASSISRKVSWVWGTRQKLGKSS